MNNIINLFGDFAPVNAMSLPDRERFKYAPRDTDLYPKGPQNALEAGLQAEIARMIQRLLAEGEVLQLSDALPQVPLTHDWITHNFAPILRTEEYAETARELVYGATAAAFRDCDDLFHYSVLSGYFRESPQQRVPIGIVRYGDVDDSPPTLIIPDGVTGSLALDAIELSLSSWSDFDMFLAPDGAHLADARAFIASAMPSATGIIH